MNMMAALADTPLKPPPAAEAAPHRAPVAVALRQAEPELTARLAALPGLRLVADPDAADVLVAEAPSSAREEAGARRGCPWCRAPRCRGHRCS